MTRWARGKTNKEQEASSWDELKNGSKEKNAKPMEQNEMKNEIPEWLEKRREARRNRRKKGKACFHCRQPGHRISECPSNASASVGICFKCGSSEHKITECTAKVKKDEFPFAICFICKETGHLSSRCPDNPRGLYPDGGGCKFCGSVEHLRRDCPDREVNKKAESSKKRFYKVSNKSVSADAIDESESDHEQQVQDIPKKKKKIVTF
ncbi:zinc finger CCHC domain-containing protein 9 isoform X2 [Hydra vulgaris]|uniref:Zinc finger CCHC domain-containing protein 9 isoform X2 n=1 Tax=Hydra vulgaris TaxID=6087 RepID=A0ABM4D9H1_HYDVU